MAPRSCSKQPSVLSLCGFYLLSFFGATLWILSFHTLSWQRKNNNDQSSGRHSPISVLGSKGKRQMPAILPGDFDGLKLLQYGDLPYQFGPWDNAPIVIESHKLIFFTIPKVACTEFKKLFRRMEGYADWQIENNEIPHSPYANGLNYLYHYKPSEADFILTNPSWTRAIFVREPKERLLSAYLDKIEGNHSYYVRKHCCTLPSLRELLQCDLFGQEDKQQMLRSPAVSFAEFLSDVYIPCKDPHWRPQAKRMPKNYWRYINFVGHLDERVQDDAKRLLLQIGAWDQFGARGWPSGAIFAENHASHATSAKENIQRYYTPELSQLVEALIKVDYESTILGFTKR